ASAPTSRSDTKPSSAATVRYSSISWLGPGVFFAMAVGGFSPAARVFSGRLPDDTVQGRENKAEEVSGPSKRAVVPACVAGSGCIVREVREIHHLAAGSGGCQPCDAGSAAPGAIVADSQPPAPMVEDPGQPPAHDYVWVDGFWHWNGAEWVWIDGRWVPPVYGYVFVAPSYYTVGDDCVYVPGRWQRDPDHPRTAVRDHRSPRRPADVRDHRTGRARPPRVFDHRTSGKPPKKTPPVSVRDHRGDPPDRGRGASDEVWLGPAPDRTPTRAGNQPVRTAPPSAAPTREPPRPSAPVTRP